MSDERIRVRLHAAQRGRTARERLAQAEAELAALDAAIARQRVRHRWTTAALAGAALTAVLIVLAAVFDTRSWWEVVAACALSVSCLSAKLALMLSEELNRRG